MEKSVELARAPTTQKKPPRPREREREWEKQKGKKKEKAEAERKSDRQLSTFSFLNDWEQSRRASGGKQKRGEKKRNSSHSVAAAWHDNNWHTSYLLPHNPGSERWPHDLLRSTGHIQPGERWTSFPATRRSNPFACLSFSFSSSPCVMPALVPPLLLLLLLLALLLRLGLCAFSDKVLFFYSISSTSR